MRITSVLLALAIIAGLWYWFIGRHDGMDGPLSAAAVQKIDDLEEQPDADQEQASTENAPPGNADNPVRVVVRRSVAQETRGELILRGRTVANRNVTVAAETAGRVMSEPLRRGSRVAEGQVLCKLESGSREAQRAEAEASLAEAQAEADAAKRLKQKGYTADMTLKTRQAQLGAAKARLDAVRWDIGKLEIRAPFDGVLETDTAEIGSFLSKGMQCANVIDLSQIKIAGFVPELEVDLLSVGQPAEAKLINGAEAQGEISFISRVSDAQTRTYSVEVTMENPDGRIRDGMTAELRISLDPNKAHFIPQAAVTLDDNGALGVRIADEGVAKFLPVKLLRDEENGFWVAGLPDEVDLIVIGQEFVRNGREIIAMTAPWDPAK